MHFNHCYCIRHRIRSYFTLNLVIVDSILFLLSITGYLLNRFWFSSYRLLFLINHFNDFLAGILFPAYVNILLAFCGKRMKGWLIPLIVILIVGLFWEYVTPLYHQCVSDPKDILAYVSGTLVYCTTIQITLFMQTVKQKENVKFPTQ